MLDRGLKVYESCSNDATFDLFAARFHMGPSVEGDIDNLFKGSTIVQDGPHAHIFSTAVAYLCVIADQHFLNNPHEEINTSNLPVSVSFNTAICRVIIHCRSNISRCLGSKFS